MKKWDYRVEALSARDFNKKESVKEIKDLLSKIGSEGWELIVTPSTFVVETSTIFATRNHVVEKCLLIFKKEIE